MARNIIIRQTENAMVENIQYIAYSRITLPAKTSLGMTGKYLGVGNREKRFFPLDGKYFFHPWETKEKETYVHWQFMEKLIQYDAKLGPTITVIAYKDALPIGRRTRGPPDPPLAERCKELFAVLRNQLLSACCPNFPRDSDHTRAPSPISEGINDTHRDSVKTDTVPIMSMRPVVVKPLRRRLNRDGYLKFTDEEEY